MSPTSEKSEKEVGPAVPAKDHEVSAVSENAPKLEEPIENKPIDTAAVTAPVDAPTPVTEPVKEPVVTKATTPAAKSASSPSAKDAIIGFIKKQESKFEVRQSDSLTFPT